VADDNGGQGTEEFIVIVFIESACDVARVVVVRGNDDFAAQLDVVVKLIIEIRHGLVVIGLGLHVLHIGNRHAAPRGVPGVGLHIYPAIHEIAVLGQIVVGIITV
jgi:hypothetical protein